MSKTDHSAFSVRAALGLLLITLAARGIVLGLAWQNPEGIWTPDSQVYWDLGVDFQAAYIETDPEFFTRGLHRTPGYPAFIAAGNLISEDPLATIGLQLTVSVLTTLLVAFWTTRMFSPRAGWFAGVVMALDPVSLVVGGLIRNETLFVFLLVVGTFCWWKSLGKDQSLGWSITTGLILGVATITRAITLYLPVLLVPAALFLAKGTMRRKLASAGLLFLMFAIPVGGWMTRNAIVADGPMLSSIEGINLLYYRAAGAIAEEEGRKRKEVELELKAEFAKNHPKLVGETEKPAEANRQRGKEGVRLLLEHPKGAVVSALKGLLRMLCGPGENATLALIGVEKSDIKKRRWQWWIAFLVQAAWIGILLLLVLFGTIRLLLRGRWFALFVILVPLAYLMLISSGPEAYSRFRVPLMPFFALLAGVGCARSVRE